MKVAILTLPLNHNYGGILQAYALETTLKRMGHDAVVLDVNRYPKIKLYKAIFAYPLRLFKRYIKGDKRVLIRRENIIRERNSYFCKYTEKFIRKNINRLEYNNLESLPKHKIDAIVVGSDQVWRPIYYKPIENAFLKFAENWKIKRIAYAASFGTDEWEYSSIQTELCKRLVKKFDIVSVRELSGIDLCEKFLNVNARQVLDPTMLLSKEDYINLVDKMNSNMEDNKQLLIYILDSNTDKQKIVDYIAKNKSLKKNNVGVQVFNEALPLNQRIQPSVEDWLQGFISAEFVVTDSFHACVFSILFNKPFVVIGNIQRGMSRFTSLLSIFGLQDRLIDEKTELTDILSQNINWRVVNSILQKKKEESMAFLSKKL